jgi:hypothetical protein
VRVQIENIFWDSAKLSPQKQKFVGSFGKTYFLETPFKLLPKAKIFQFVIANSNRGFEFDRDIQN